jgi:hypothetical protein
MILELCDKTAKAEKLETVTSKNSKAKPLWQVAVYSGRKSCQKNL